ncbi:hypothetical protein BJ912DRAFT_1059795 [Pholiota molesta]|nr:hypothetical protein BJ912DRAFT_1059795 [Pholiota molesta]
MRTTTAWMATGLGDDDVGDVDVDVHVRTGTSAGTRATSPLTGHRAHRQLATRRSHRRCLPLATCPSPPMRDVGQQFATPLPTLPLSSPPSRRMPLPSTRDVGRQCDVGSARHVTAHTAAVPLAA